MEPEEPAGQGLGQAARYGALGYTFAFSIILFAGAGYLLDRWLGLGPVLTIAGTLAGTVLAIVRVYQMVQQDQAESRAKRGPGRPGES
jgi:F0F1-type ATP synthase assembly protein I